MRVTLPFAFQASASAAKKTIQPAPAAREGGWAAVLPLASILLPSRLVDYIVTSQGNHVALVSVNLPVTAAATQRGHPRQRRRPSGA
jgi:hypothetical protein